VNWSKERKDQKLNELRVAKPIKKEPCSFRGILPSEYEQVIPVALGLSSRERVKGLQREVNSN
jgi:hypothetical protein